MKECFYSYAVGLNIPPLIDLHDSIALRYRRFNSFICITCASGRERGERRYIKYRKEHAVRTNNLTQYTNYYISDSYPEPCSTGVRFGLNIHGQHIRIGTVR